MQTAAEIRTILDDESRYFYPIERGAWIEDEWVAEEAGLEVSLRDKYRPTSAPDMHRKHWPEGGTL
jgi:hypothetical protein